MRIAPFPAPPVIEAEEASPVDWASAMPPRDQWPANLADLHANNPAGAKTWSEVEAAMHRLVAYHAVRDISLILSVMARLTRRASARTPRARSARLPLLAGAAAALLKYASATKHSGT